MAPTLAPKFTFQVGLEKRSGSRLLMSVTAESEPCDYFGAKVQINPVGHDLADLNQMCFALQPLLKALPSPLAGLERQ